MASGEPAPSERLAAYVEARAAELGMTWQDIRSAGGPGVRTLNDLRNGRWLTVKASTLRKLDAVLHLKPGSSQALLDGGEPVPLPPASDWRPESQAAGYSVAEIVAAEKLGRGILRRFRALDGVPPGRAGELLFPGSPLSAAWDAGWAASAEDPAARAEQVALIVALQEVRRAGAGRSSRGA